MGPPGSTTPTQRPARRSGNRVFISYRRDDAAGHAGRLEAALEQRLGPGSAFRDVLDIPPGEDFVHVIEQRLAAADAVVVLIGPRWAGTDAVGATGRRRIDDDDDFVRREVQAALASGARVVPVLLPGATMPAEDELPPSLKPLARRNALPISETHWDADVDRLLASLALRPARAMGPWAAAGAAVAAAVVGAFTWLPWAPAPDPAEQLIGTWQAEVRYDWGDRHVERLQFVRHAGELTGSASFLRYARPIENASLDGKHLRFQTRSTDIMQEQERETTHTYTAELRGSPPDEVLAFRLQTTGGFGSHQPITFEARRVPPVGPASAPATP